MCHRHRRNATSPASRYSFPPQLCIPLAATDILSITPLLLCRAYRAQTLLAIGSDLSKELDLMDELVKEHLKSYQVW